MKTASALALVLAVASTVTASAQVLTQRGFAEGAVRAAEWLVGKKGFYDFKDIWREL